MVLTMGDSSTSFGRIRWSQGLSVRETSCSVGMSTGVIDKTVCRARGAWLMWDQVVSLPEAELEARLYGSGPSAPRGRRGRSRILCTWLIASESESAHGKNPMSLGY